MNTMDNERDALTVRRLQAVVDAGYVPRPDAAHVADIKDGLAIISRLSAAPASPASERNAGEVERLRAVVKRCDMLIEQIVDDASDEGGRVYFGSTDQLDDLRKLSGDLEHEVYQIMEVEGD